MQGELGPGGKGDRNSFGGAKEEGEGIEEHVSVFEFGVSNRATVEVDRLSFRC